MRHFFLLFSIMIGQLTLAGQDNNTILYPYAQQGRWGIVDENRQIVLPPGLDSISLFSPLGKEAVHTQMASGFLKEKVGLLNEDGRWLLKPRADQVGWAEYYAPDRYWVQQKGKYGLLDVRGKKARWLIKPRFTQVGNFQGRKVALAVVAIDDRWGGVNSRGETVVPCPYETAALLDDYADYPAIKLTLQDSVRYLDAFGAILPAEEARQLEEEAILLDDLVVEEERYRGEDIIQYRTRTIPQNNGTLVILEKGWRGSAYQALQQLLIPSDYEIEEVRYRADQIETVVVRQNSRLGCWNATGLQSPGAVYDTIEWLSFGFHGKLGKTSLNGRKGLVGSDGSSLLPTAFSHITPTGRLFYLQHPDGFTGYATADGKIFLPTTVPLGN